MLGDMWYGSCNLGCPKKTRALTEFKRVLQETFLTVVWVQGWDSSETIEIRAKHVIMETPMLERHRRNG